MMPHPLCHLIPSPPTWIKKLFLNLLERWVGLKPNREKGKSEIPAKLIFSCLRDIHMQS